MFVECPLCNSKRAVCISSVQRVAICAKAINRMIIRNISDGRVSLRNSVALAALEELANRLFDALDTAVKVKYRNLSGQYVPTHACLRCGHVFREPDFY